MHYPAYLKEKFGKEVVAFPFGFAIYSIESDICYIEDIYIVPEERRRGLASEIADLLTEKAKGLGCKTLLGSVNTQITDSHASLLSLLAYGFKLTKADKDIVYFTKGIES